MPLGLERGGELVEARTGGPAAGGEHDARLDRHGRFLLENSHRGRVAPRWIPVSATPRNLMTLRYRRRGHHWIEPCIRRAMTVEPCIRLACFGIGPLPADEGCGWAKGGGRSDTRLRSGAVFPAIAGGSMSAAGCGDPALEASTTI